MSTLTYLGRYFNLTDPFPLWVQSFGDATSNLLKDWWAWVDLNHRPRPYQGSVVRSYKDLQVPRGLPKTAQVLQDHSNCGFNCGLKASLFDRLRPGADCPHMAFGLALASSHSLRDGVWLAPVGRRVWAR